MAAAQRSLLDRALDKFVIDDGCWLWTAGRTRAGYGLLRRGRADEGFILAHRWMYELMRGEIPSGTEIDHICRNRACVRPNHLRAVTHKVNMQNHSRPSVCPRGHDNWRYRRGTGWRVCITCDHERRRHRRAAAKSYT